jgi:hypothetical protein
MSETPIDTAPRALEQVGVALAGAVSQTREDAPLELAEEGSGPRQADPDDVFAGRLLSLADWSERTGADWCVDAVPRPAWLIDRQGEADQAGGVLPLGVPGVLIAPPRGRTSVGLVEIALTVASGGGWLGGGYLVDQSAAGPVLLVLASDDAVSARARIYAALRTVATQTGRSIEDLSALVGERLRVLPGAGLPMALVVRDARTGSWHETPALARLRDELVVPPPGHVRWALVLIDDAVRVAGGDDHADLGLLATIETLVQETPGHPTVLLVGRGERDAHGALITRPLLQRLAQGTRWLGRIEWDPYAGIPTIEASIEG